MEIHAYSIMATHKTFRSTIVFQDRTHHQSGNRLISAQPVTDWFVGFDGQIKYYDANYILITFKPTIADDAKSVFQLRNAYGNILWTQAVERFTYISEAVVVIIVFGYTEEEKGKKERTKRTFTASI